MDSNLAQLVQELKVARLDAYGLVAFWTLILRSPVAILVFAAGAFGLIWALTGSLMLDLAAVVLFVGVFLFMRHRKRRKSAFSSKGHSDPSEHLDGR